MPLEKLQKYICTSDDETRRYTIIKVKLGGLKKIRVRSATVDDTTNPFKGIALGYTDEQDWQVGEGYCVLVTGRDTPRVPLQLIREQIIVASLIIVFVFDINASDVIYYSIDWEELPK